MTVVLLTVSSRVAPGVLTAAAWDVLRGAGSVVVDGSATAHAAALADALTAAGVAVHGGPAPTADDDAQDASVHVLDVGRLAEVQAALSEAGAAVAVVPGVVELPGSRLLDLVALMDRLRSPGGCSWDAEQTHSSLMQYLLEETYEVLEAIELEDRAALVEELGDLLLQVVFHARIAAEAGPQGFDVDDVADGITTKLVRRHPHVFASAKQPGGDTAHTERRWDAIKRAEKGRTSSVDGVPMGQPALALAAKLLGRVERAGLTVEVAPGAGTDAGDDLLAAVARMRTEGVDPEAALRAAVRRFSDRVRVVEAAGG